MCYPFWLILKHSCPELNANFFASIELFDKAGAGHFSDKYFVKIAVYERVQSMIVQARCFYVANI